VDSTFAMSAIPANSANNACYILSEESDLKISGNNIVLEEFAFTASIQAINIGDRPLQNWIADYLFDETSYWYDKAQKSIVILSDDDFKDFVNLSTEVITRIKIDNATGTVANGQLFTEEYLPAESVLYTIVLASPEFSDKTDKMNEGAVMKFFGDTLPPVVQIGGNATLGKGIVRTIF